MCLMSAIELTTNFSKFGIKYTQAIQLLIKFKILCVGDPIFFFVTPLI